MLGSLIVHLHMQHGTATDGKRHWETTSPGGEPCTYKMAFPTSGGPRNCPIEGCWERAATRMVMRFNFFHRHFRDTVIILE